MVNEDNKTITFTFNTNLQTKILKLNYSYNHPSCFPVSDLEISVFPQI